MGFEQISIQEMLQPNALEFIRSNPSQLRKLKNALKKINFKFKGNFIVDLTMPGYVGGYYAESIETIAINPMLLLMGTEKQIAHVLFHEGLHAGIYTDGTKVDDESLVEAMTKKKMEELYGGGIQSGYDGLVTEFNEYFGDTSFSELSEMVESGDEDTFNNMLEVMVLNRQMDNDSIEDLSFEEIKRKLKDVWSTLQKLFPRMMNSIANRNIGPHAGTNVELHHFKMDELLENMARKIIGEKPELFQKLFEELTPEDKEYNVMDVVRGMFDLGIGYLFDAEPEFVRGKIEKFLEYKNTVSFCRNFKFQNKYLVIST